MAQDTMSTQKNIIILGGSYAGVSTAHHLLKHTLPVLPQKDTYKVILISAASEAMCRQACPRALISDDFFPQNKLFVSISKQFEQYPQYNFEFIQAHAETVDHEQRTVTFRTSEALQTRTVPFHALVIATGASTPSPLLGLNRDEFSLRSAWASFRAALSTATSITIAGGGPAGVETAGELGEYLNGRAGLFQSQLIHPKVPITLITSGATILPALRPAIAATAEAYLAKLGVTVLKNSRVTSVSPLTAGATFEDLTTPASLTLSTGGKPLCTDLFIPATGFTPNTVFLSKDLLTPARQVETAPSLRVDAAGPRIYALGDVSSYARPAVHNILMGVPVLGANMKRDLLLAAGLSESDGRVPAERAFEEDMRETQMVPVGRSKGVGAAMGWRLPGWLVWLVKGRDYWLWTVGSVWSGGKWLKEG